LPGFLNPTNQPPAPQPGPRPAPQSSSQSSPQGKATTSLTQVLAQQTKIKKFSDYEELKEFLENNASAQESEGFGYAGIAYEKNMARGLADETVGVGAPEATPQSASFAPETSDKSTQATGDYSRTNVQVEGVDEADIIKTDGSYIYAVAKKNLFIVKAIPAQEAQVLAMIKFKNNPSEIYINGNYLIVYGRDYEIYKTLSKRRPDYYFPRRSNYVFLKVFDITDKANPRQVRDLDFEGYYTTSRLIGDYLYFITYNQSRYYFDDDIPVPRILSDGKALPVGCGEAKCYNPPVYYIDIPGIDYNFVTVTAVNVKDSQTQPQSEIYLLPTSQNTYVSPNNIYLTYTKYVSEYELYMSVVEELIVPRLSKKKQERIAKIKQVPSYILTPTEKRQKIMGLVEYYISTLPEAEQDKLEQEVQKKLAEKYKDISAQLQKTVIHKIAISGDKLEYKAHGEVTGRVLNQFSMNEEGDYFYIATTRDRTFSPWPIWREFGSVSIKKMDFSQENKSYSNLYVLDKNLQPVGSLEKLAVGEQIHSVRFMQKRAYLVTFRQIDPLFVIDLANPAKPRVLGQLKIPGYSDYLHPYDETTLIGLGKETATTSWGGVTTKGLKISLFDVSDVEHPQEVAKYVLGEQGSDSLALRDHKAFQFWPKKNLLVIPVTVRQPLKRRGWGQVTFMGAVVFTLSKDKIELKGKIDHKDRVFETRYYPDYETQVKRALYINDTLYTFSNKYLKMNKLDDLEPIKILELKKEPASDFEIIN
jgi:uncharacterized secreted protein with C-terminal beta-propeller domain